MPEEYGGRITVRIPDRQYRLLQELVESGEFPNESEAIREAVRGLIDKRVKNLDIRLSVMDFMEKYGKTDHPI